MMRWLVRGVRAIVVALSVLLAMLWAVLLTRSYRCSDVLRFWSPYGSSVLVTCRGGAFILTQPFVTPPEWKWGGVRLGDPAIPFTAGFGDGQPVGLGVRYGSYFTSMAHNAWAVAVPYGLLIVVSLLPAIAALLAPAGWRRLRWLWSGHRGRRGFPVALSGPQDGPPRQ